MALLQHPALSRVLRIPEVALRTLVAEAAAAEEAAAAAEAAAAEEAMMATAVGSNPCLELHQ